MAITCRNFWSRVNQSRAEPCSLEHGEQRIGLPRIDRERLPGGSLGVGNHLCEVCGVADLHEALDERREAECLGAARPHRDRTFESADGLRIDGLVADGFFALVNQRLKTRVAGLAVSPQFPRRRAPQLRLLRRCRARPAAT